MFVRNGTRCCRIPEVVRTVKEARYVPVNITTTTVRQEDELSSSNEIPLDGDDLYSTKIVEMERTTIKSADPAEPGPGPVGDCPCGSTEMKIPAPRILAEDNAGVHRPWLAHVSIEKNSGEPVECTASLLNM